MIKEQLQPELLLPGDSWDYELLTEGVKLSKDVQGMTCEIGLRRGGGTLHIIDAIASHCPDKVHIAIDPYGSIDYEHKEKQFVKLDYTNDMKDECLSALHYYTQQKKVHFIFFNLQDGEFFDRYGDGVPVYNINKRMETKYSFVHFDGPHAVGPLLAEIDFFLPRIFIGACFCFDDVTDYYDHNAVEQYLFLKNFKLIKKTSKKALYRYEG